MKKRICVAITGASGSLYAERFIELAWHQVDRIYLIATTTGKQVVQYELAKGPRCESFDLIAALKGKGMTEAQSLVIQNCQEQDFFAPAASGSAAPNQMVVLPCSMGTLARIATGVSTSLTERAADVMLKQNRPLVLCARETPLSRIHLKNMLEVTDAGARVLPLMPAFYQHPKSVMDMVDFCVGRVLEELGLEHKLYPPWNEKRL